MSAADVKTMIIAYEPVDDVAAARRRDDAVTATTSRAEHRIHWKRSERPQTRKRNHPLPSFLETTRLNEVKAPPHDGTPRSRLVHLRLLQLLRPVLLPLGMLFS